MSVKRCCFEGRSRDCGWPHYSQHLPQMVNDMNQSVRLVSWSIGGFGRGAVERLRVFSHLKRLKPVFFFLFNRGLIWELRLKSDIWRQVATTPVIVPIHLIRQSPPPPLFCLYLFWVVSVCMVFFFTSFLVVLKMF